MKPLRWLTSPTGAMISEATRFLIKPMYEIKAGCLVLGVNGSLGVEKRCILRDRMGCKGRGASYLCLTPGDAQRLAEDLVRGKGLLE
jgi:hypothetical protein